MAGPLQTGPSNSPRDRHIQLRLRPTRGGLLEEHLPPANATPRGVKVQSLLLTVVDEQRPGAQRAVVGPSVQAGERLAPRQVHSSDISSFWSVIVDREATLDPHDATGDTDDSHEGRVAGSPILRADQLMHPGNQSHGKRLELLQRGLVFDDQCPLGSRIFWTIRGLAASPEKPDPLVARAPEPDITGAMRQTGESPQDSAKLPDIDYGSTVSRACVVDPSGGAR
jgi:hypothetical protein